MRLRISLMALLLGGILVAPGTARAQVTVSADITSNTTWTSNNEYLLDGLVFVDNGATLTIEPGTVIKGLEDINITTGEGASALVVRRGAKINAVGTASQPIIFTSELDDVNDPLDLDQRDRGLWGGLILLGRATTNEPTIDIQIEGIPTNLNALYGGTDDADNSGTLKYVSIRHGGFSISGVEGDEINGLTLGAVGSGTTIDYVEVYANFDDCFEWFGGTVEAKHLVGAFCGDDSFDYDQGFRGKGQFWFSIHDTDTAGRGGEHDGGDSAGDDATPFSIPVISNVTYIGSGASALVAGGDGNDRTFAIRDNAGGKYYNSIFSDYPGVALNIEDLASGEDSRARLEAGDLVFNNNIWFGYGAGSTLDAIVDGDFAESIIAANANQITDPQLASISRTFGGFGLDPRPAVGSPALSGAVSVSAISRSSFFEDVTYYGAFGADLWIQDWTALSANGFLGLISEVSVEPVDSEIPEGYVLEQNYPNPFNPTTTIEFSIAETQRVQLAVFDMLCRQVATLVDGVQAAGSYRVTFDAANLASGMYLYRIETANAVLTRSMTLLR